MSPLPQLHTPDITFHEVIVFTFKTVFHSFEQQHFLLPIKLNQSVIMTLILSTQKQAAEGLCKATLRWTSANKESRSKDFSVLFQMVNLSFLSLEFLKDLYYQEVRYDEPSRYFDIL